VSKPQPSKTRPVDVVIAHANDALRLAGRSIAPHGTARRRLLDNVLGSPSAVAQRNGAATGLRVLIASPPKTGNTWLRCLLQHAYGLTVPHDRLPSIRDPRALERLAAQGTFGPGTVFHQHVRYSAALCETVERLDGRIVTILRDPYDLFVSLYFFRQEFDPKNPDRNLLRGKAIDDPMVLAYLRHRFGKTLEMAREWVASGRSLTIRYEDLHRDPIQALTDLTNQIGPLPAEAIAQAVDACRADRMRRQKTTMLKHVRSATVGDWQNHLEPEHLAIFREQHAEAIQALGYEVR